MQFVFFDKGFIFTPSSNPETAVCSNKGCECGPEKACTACLCYLPRILCATRGLSDRSSLGARSARSLFHVLPHYFRAWRPRLAQISSQIGAWFTDHPLHPCALVPRARFGANWGQIQQKLWKLLKSWVWNEWAGGDKGFDISSNSQPPPLPEHSYHSLSCKNILNSQQPTQWHF